MTYIKINYWKGNGCHGKIVEIDKLQTALKTLFEDGARIHYVGEIKGLSNV
jgi:hypothetical protein